MRKDVFNIDGTLSPRRVVSSGDGEAECLSFLEANVVLLSTTNRGDSPLPRKR